MRYKEVFIKPAVWISLLVVLVITFTYNWLGGFKPLQVEVVGVQDYNLIGKEFEGTYDSDTIQKYFSEMKNYIGSGLYQGPIVIIYDQEPQGRKALVKNFVGIRMSEATEATPSGMTQRKIPAKRALQASKACHSALMPNPDKIAVIFKELTDSGSLTPYDFSIEMYYPDNRLVIQQPLIPE